MQGKLPCSNEKHRKLTHDSVQSPWMLESMKPRLKTRGGATHARCRGDASLATSHAPSAMAATYTTSHNDMANLVDDQHNSWRPSTKFDTRVCLSRIAAALMYGVMQPCMKARFTMDLKLLKDNICLAV